MPTNLEHYKEAILKKALSNTFSCALRIVRCGEQCNLPYDCGECIENSLDWLMQEYKESKQKITLTLLEKSIMECAVSRGYKYIARSKNDDLLVIFEEEPTKEEDGDWYAGVNGNINHLDLFNDKFCFIQCTDEEPVHIPTLLKEAEIIKEGE